ASSVAGNHLLPGFYNSQPSHHRRASPASAYSNHAMTSAEILDLFRSTNALLDGHFPLRSGLHSRTYFQCALLLQHTQIAARVCGALAEKLREIPAERVISPAL